MGQGARFGALSKYLRRDFQAIPNNHRAANVPIGTLIRTFETTSPIRRSPHQCPANRLFVESTHAPHKHVWDLHVRRRGVNDSMRIVAGAVRRTEGCVAARWSRSTASSMEQVLGALRSHPAVRRRKLKSTGNPRRSLQPCRFAASSLTGRARNPSLVTVWQAAPSSAFSKKNLSK